MKEFWTRFSEYVKTNQSPFTVHSPHPRNWLGTSIRTARLSGVGFNRLTRENAVVTYLWLDGGTAKETFDKLFADRERIEMITGPLVWSRLNNKRASHIKVKVPYINDQQAFAWMVEMALKFKEALGQ